MRFEWSWKQIINEIEHVRLAREYLCCVGLEITNSSCLHNSEMTFERWLFFRFICLVCPSFGLHSFVTRVNAHPLLLDTV